MKINHLLPGQKITGTAASKQPAEVADSFQALLEKRLQPLDRTGGILEPAAVGKTVNSIPVNVRLEGLDISEAAIDTLETFSTALGDTSFAADDLEPFVADLEEKTAALLDIKEQIPASDPLRQILERVATTAYMESARYRRGEYGH